jgi:hypothetical protein
VRQETGNGKGLEATAGAVARSERIEWLVAIVADELRHATEKFPPFNSAHEGKAVIEEELDELWEHVKADTAYGADAMREAVQVAAMAMRYVHDLATTMGPVSATEAAHTPPTPEVASDSPAGGAAR